MCAPLSMWQEKFLGAIPYLLRASRIETVPELKFSLCPFVLLNFLPAKSQYMLQHQVKNTQQKDYNGYLIDAMHHFNVDVGRP